MNPQFTLDAVVRDNAGTRASRRLRHQDMVPAILYGGREDPVLLALPARALSQNIQHEGFFSHILTLNLEGRSEQAIVRDVQRDPAKDTVLHIDFQRVVEGAEIRAHVPLHFIGEAAAPGVKFEKGLINHMITEIEVICLPKHLPEFIEVDLSGLHVHDTLHLTDLKLPEGVRISVLAAGTEHHNLAVVSILAPAGGVAAGEEAPEQPVGGA